MRRELYVASIDGTSWPYRLNGPVLGAGVVEFGLSLDSKLVLFRGRAGR